MKVVLFNGSPKERGCTYTAISLVAEELEKAGVETEIIHAAKQGFTQADVDEAARKCIDSDGIVLSSPVWYASSCGLSDYFYDLLFLKIDGKMRFKFGASVVSCRRGGATAAFDQLNKYFTICEMPVVSSCYWNQVHGSTPEDVMKDEEGVYTMRLLGQNMAYLIKAVKKADLPQPEKGEKPRTNFIR